MNLISILFALALELYYKPVHDWRRFDWFENLTDTINTKLAGQSWRDGPLGVILVIGVVLFAVWLLNAMLAGVATIFSVVFGIFILVLTLGPKDLVHEVGHVTDALARGDDEAACLAATSILGEKTDIGDAGFKRTFQTALLSESTRRVFGVLLWFMLLGPVGAVMFRLSSELSLKHSGEGGFARASQDLYRILIWIPVRLQVIGFAIAGSFVHTLGHLNLLTDFWKEDSESLLVECGLGAISHELSAAEDDNEAVAEEVEHVLALIKRTLMVWLTALALLTLSGWIF